MGRPGITRDQVIETAEALANEGTTPTVVAVRKRLGGGSPNNITKWLGEWREQTESTRADALAPLPEELEPMMRQVWGLANKHAKAMLEGEREALSKAREDIERERAEMMGEVDRLDTELETAKLEVTKVNEALDQTRSEVLEAKAIAAERGRRIEDQVREIADVRAQLTEAVGKASRLEGKIEQQEQTIETARAQARKDAEIKEDLTRERDQARADQARALAEVDSLKRQISDEKKIIDASGKKVAKLETDLEQERQGRAVAEQAAAELRVQIATLTERAAQIEPLRALLEKLQKPDQSKSRE